MPEVSVVITTYNRPDKLKEALQTALNQTFKDIEIIVVDGKNSKRNKKVTESFRDKRIKYIQVAPKKVNLPSYEGVQHSRNVGCKNSNGKYIAMLDDDDLWEPEKIEKQLKAFINKSIGLVICYSKMYLEKSHIIYKNKLSPTYKDLLKSYNLSTTSSFLIRKDVLEEINYWNESLRGMHEYDIALKITKMGYQIVTIREPLTIRNRYGSNFSINSHIKIAEMLDLWHYYGKDFISYIGVKGFLFNVIKTLFLIDIYLLGHIFKGDVWKIIYKIKTSLKVDVLG